MKKRSLSILCVLCLIVGLLPATAGAAVGSTTTYAYAYDAQRTPGFPEYKGDEITAKSFGKPLKYGAESGSSTQYTSNAGSWTLTEVGLYSKKSEWTPAPTSYLDSVVNSVAVHYALSDAGKAALTIHKLTDQDNTLVGYGVVVAVDEVNGYALFVGDLWNNSGAGYLLSNSEITATSVTFNAEKMVTSSYAVSLAPTAVTFANAQVGYSAPAAKTITVSNAGNTATGALTVALSGTGADKFELSKTTIADIAVSGSDTFTVAPKTGLAAGTYTATITVKGANVLPETVTVSFTVDAPTTHSVTVTANNASFGNASASPANATVGAEITLSATAETGYKFKQWRVTGGGVTIADNKFLMPDADVTIVADFEPMTYTVTLNAGDGSVAAGANVASYTYGVGAALPGATQVTRAGYTFAGWYETANPGETDTPVTQIGTAETGAKTFYAKWTAKKYTVTLNAQGGSGAPGSIEVTYNGTYTGLVSPTRSSYTFAGWFTAATGGSQVQSSDTVRITAAQTLYAHWTLDSDADLEDVAFTHAYDVQRSPVFPAKGAQITLSGFDYPLVSSDTRGTTYEGSWTLTRVGTYHSIRSTSKDSENLQGVVNGIAGSYTGITADEIVVHELKNGGTHIAYGVVVAYDAATGRTVFLGDTWNSSGAGYLLATGTQTDATTMTATAVPTDFVQAATYRITLDKTGTHTFAAAATGYAAQSPVTVTVSNAGSAATGALTVALSGAGADKFELSKNTIADIAVSGSDTFTVAPKTGLAAGTYTATVTVSGTNVVPKSFNVTFTVHTVTVTFDANGGTVNPASGTTGIDGKLTSALPTPVRTGNYFFGGWYTEAENGTKITADTEFATNTTIFAHWVFTGDYYPAMYLVEVENAKNGAVRVSAAAAAKGTTVFIQTTPDKGYTLKTLTATDESGKLLGLTQVGDGKYAFTMPASKVMVKAVFADDNAVLNHFVDVPATADYKDAVMWAVQNGITTGTGASTFGPDEFCTRAQMVTFLWRAAGSPEPKSSVNPFTDVNLGEYYGKAVLWAVENGITKGTSATTFGPQEYCTRAQMVTFICRMAAGKPVGGAVVFTDVPADVYYAEDVRWAVEKGLVKGDGNGKFSPEEYCTRAQMVTVLYRYFGK